MGINQLRPEDLEKIHEKIAKENGLSGDLIDREALNNAIEASFLERRNDYQGHIAEADHLGRKTAALGFTIVNEAPFVEGNEELSLEAMKYFLSVNGREFSKDDDYLKHFIHGVTIGEIKKEDFIKNIDGNVRIRNLKKEPVLDLKELNAYEERTERENIERAGLRPKTEIVREDKRNPSDEWKETLNRLKERRDIKKSLCRDDDTSRSL